MHRLGHVHVLFNCLYTGPKDVDTKIHFRIAA